MLEDHTFKRESFGYLQKILESKAKENPGLIHENDDDIYNHFTPFMKQRHSDSSQDNPQILQHCSDSQSRKENYITKLDYSIYQDQFGIDGTFGLHLNEEKLGSQNQGDQGGHQNTLDDSFLELVDQHLQKVLEGRQKLSKQSQMNKVVIKQIFYNKAPNSRLSTLNDSQQRIQFSKKEIRHNILQNEVISDSIQMSNLEPAECLLKIKESPFQFRIQNNNQLVMKDQIEILLKPFQTIQIQFIIKRREQEIGNIYENLTIEVFEIAEGQKLFASKHYVKFEVNFVKPQLSIVFWGHTTVSRILEHKIALLQLFPNQMEDYSLSLIYSQQLFASSSSDFPKIQCQIESKGYISVYPTAVILYRNEPVKIVIRKLTNISSVAQTSAIVIRPLNSSLVYVFGVKCMPRQTKYEAKQEVKVNKLTI